MDLTKIRRLEALLYLEDNIAERHRIALTEMTEQSAREMTKYHQRVV